MWPMFTKKGPNKISLQQLFSADYSCFALFYLCHVPTINFPVLVIYDNPLFIMALFLTLGRDIAIDGWCFKVIRIPQLATLCMVLEGMAQLKLKQHSPAVADYLSSQHGIYKIVETRSSLLKKIAICFILQTLIMG